MTYVVISSFENIETVCVCFTPGTLIDTMSDPVVTPAKACIITTAEANRASGVLAIASARLKWA